jgi:hypothetical protein
VEYEGKMQKEGKGLKPSENKGLTVRHVKIEKGTITLIIPLRGP